MFENWSDVATEEESNDEYDNSSNNEVDNEVLEIDDSIEAVSESEMDVIISDLVEKKIKRKSLTWY